MREIRSYGSVGERGGNKPLYPENPLRNMYQPLVCHDGCNFPAGVNPVRVICCSP